MNMVVERVETQDGISWHTERFYPSDDTLTESDAEDVVLIPSGEGDCESLKALAKLLAATGKYRVLTFDTPGFSRTTAPAKAYTKVTPQLLAGQTIGLLDQLEIRQATFFGCSSGGGTTLALCALYPDRVKCGIVHEVPLDKSDLLLNMQKLSDQEIITTCEQFYGNGIVEQEVNNGRKKWEALGTEYHDRLKKNYVTWVRGYIDAVEVGGRELASVAENLQRRPIFWTVGSLNPGADSEGGIWKSNFELAKNAGLKVDTTRLHSLHFPSVTVTEELAGWISECVAGVEA